MDLGPLSLITLAHFATEHKTHGFNILTDQTETEAIQNNK